MSFNEPKAKEVFDGFKSTNEFGEICMEQDAIESWLQQIGVDPQEVLAIYIAMFMEAKYMGEFSWAEFKKGCSKLGADSVDSWKNVVPRLRQECQTDAKKHEIYKFAFNFAQEKGKKNVDVELACDLWDLLIGTKCGFLEKWKTFCMGKFERGEIRVITRDTWDLFWDLNQQTSGNFNNFEDDGAWPTIIDEFVEFVGQ